MRLVALGGILQLAHLLLLHQLEVVVAPAATAARLRLVVLAGAEHLVLRLVQVTLLQLHQAKEIMVGLHQVLLALAAGVLVPLEITLLRQELQWVVQVVQVYLVLLLELLTIGQVAVVVGYLQIIR
jgi:hypothetical protein